MRFFALLIGENADIDGLLIFGFYLRRHAWRKNISGIVQGYCRFSRIKVDFAPLGISDLVVLAAVGIVNWSANAPIPP